MDLLKQLRWAARKKPEAADPQQEPKAQTEAVKSAWIEERAVPVVSKDANPCEGCFANWWHKAIDFGEGIFSVTRFAAQMAVSHKADEDTQRARESICRTCPLFNTLKDGVFSCGKPVTEKLFRIRGKEGCGCWLNLKWLGKSEKCPLEPPKW